MQSILLFKQTQQVGRDEVNRQMQSVLLFKQTQQVASCFKCQCNILISREKIIPREGSVSVRVLLNVSFDFGKGVVAQ